MAAASSALVTIIVAVIGVVGAVVPAIYVSSLQTRPDPDVGLEVFSTSFPPNGDTNKTWFIFTITNERGTGPATNLSLILVTNPKYGQTAEILKVTNAFSSTDVILPQYNNKTLEPGFTENITESPLVIRIPKLIHGAGSVVSLLTVVNNTKSMSSISNNTLERLRLYAVYDQGSDLLAIDEGHFPNHYSTNLYYSPNLTKMSEAYSQQTQRVVGTFFSPGLITYYLIFFGILGSIVYLYFRRRRASRRLITHIVEIHDKLRDDPTFKDPFEEKWFHLTVKQRTDRHHIHDYLIIDTFYYTLKKRNDYLNDYLKEPKIGTDKKENELKVRNSELYKTAEDVMRKVDWDKYR